METKSASERFARVIETAKNTSSSGEKPMQSEEKDKLFSEVRKVGKPLIAFGLLFPLTIGIAGVAIGELVGLSVGGATVFGVLCASASYIAAPAAVTVALPKANATVALMSSIGVTFPFNLIIGIPVYFKVAEFLSTF